MRLFLLIACLCFAGPVQGAGLTEKACLQSERSPGREVCACAQFVADQVLSGNDQKMAAEIIRDPDHFYQYYGSKRPARKAFLERYRAWGDAAARSCRR